MIKGQQDTSFFLNQRKRIILHEVDINELPLYFKKKQIYVLYLNVSNAYLHSPLSNLILLIFQIFLPVKSWRCTNVT